MLLPQPPTHTRENEKENVNENENTAWVSVSVHEKSIAVFQKELQSEQLYMGDERVQCCIVVDKRNFTSMSSTGNAQTMGIWL